MGVSNFMVIIKNQKNIAYWFHDKEGNISRGIAISDRPLKDMKYVKMVSEKFPDGKFVTTLTCGDKSITINDDGSCKSGYKYGLNIQKTIHKLLNLKFPSSQYDAFIRKTMNKKKGDDLCK